MERGLSMISGSSTLSTPELSPRSLCSDSSCDGSFFSALSSTDNGHDDGLNMVVSSPLVTFHSLDVSSAKVLLHRDSASRKQRHRPAPLPLFDPPSIPGPRRLKKSKPNDTAPSSPSGGSVFANPAGLLRRATGYGPPRQSKNNRPRRSSLPSIPSASILPVAFRTPFPGKKVQFKSPVKDSTFMRSRRRVARSPYPNTNTSTDALVSLAWTGEFPIEQEQGSPTGSPNTSAGDTFFHSSMAISSTCLRNGWKSSWSLGHYGDEVDTPLSSLQTPALTTPHFHEQGNFRKGHRRRWTLAMAIMDDGISDEMLVDELEKMRTLEKMWRFESPASVNISSVPPDTPQTTELSTLIDYEEPVSVLRPSLPSLSDPALSAVWQSARRALLICRELVRTERHYLLGLRTIAACQTKTCPPPLMLTYLPALVDVSERLMTLMEKNPSAQGVSNAFLSMEDELEAAFVSWCGVVGGFFVGREGRPGTRKRPSSASPSQMSAAQPSSIKRRVNSWGKRINSFKALASSTVPPTPVNTVHKDSRGPTVRELAILPTQRIMRYALLFKDLFSHTPPNNPSALTMEKAMKAAISLAQKCDRAQDNAAFLTKPTVSV